MGMNIHDSSNSANRGGGSGGGPSNPLLQALTDAIRTLSNIFSKEIRVKIPENIVNPEGSITFDISRLQTINPGLTETVLEYKAKVGETIRFIRYGFFNNKVLATEVEFFPTIDDVRILTYHGDPMENFKLYLSLGPDLAENNLAFCDVTLLPGQTLKWRASNTAAAIGEFGVRMRGYKVNSNKVQASGG